MENIDKKLYRGESKRSLSNKGKILSGLFFATDIVDASNYTDTDDKIIEYSLSDSARIYNGISSLSFILNTSGLLHKRYNILNKLYNNVYTVADILEEDSDYEYVKDEYLDSFYHITLTVAKIELEKLGYQGAHWSWEDDLTPDLYQIWDLSIVKEIGEISATDNNVNTIKEDIADSTWAKEIRKDSDAWAILYGWQYKNQKVVEICPEEHTEESLQARIKNIIKSYDKVSEKPTGNRYARGGDFTFFVLYNNSNRNGNSKKIKFGVSESFLLDKSNGGVTNDRLLLLSEDKKRKNKRVRKTKKRKSKLSPWIGWWQFGGPSGKKCNGAHKDNCDKFSSINDNAGDVTYNTDMFNHMTGADGGDFGSISGSGNSLGNSVTSGGGDVGAVSSGGGM